MTLRCTFGLAALLPIGCASHGGHHAHSASHRFDDAERWAKVFDDPSRDAWQKPAEVIALMAIEPGMVVVDLGAGTGYFLPYLAQAVGPSGRVIALDVEADMVRYMNERAERAGLTNVSARQVPFEDPALQAASVERILVVDTWHHIQGRPQYAEKLAAALEEGGQLFIVDFTMEADHGPPPEHRLRPEDVRAELEAAGFEVELRKESLPDQYVIVGTRRSPPPP